MTSSLVGSEMCIRDRVSMISNRQVQGKDEPWVIAQSEEKNMQWTIKRPVSYTHLTLPTICSV
eukprot:6271411-Prorocentrum_lima.AAC.1